MNFQAQQHGAVNVLKPQGPLAGSDADEFKDRLLEMLTGSLGRCVVDASDMPFVDSRALEVLVEASDKALQTGQVLKLCGLTETLRQVLDLTDLSSRFEYFEDVNAAVRSFL